MELGSAGLVLLDVCVCVCFMSSQRFTKTVCPHETLVRLRFSGLTLFIYISLDNAMEPFFKQYMFVAQGRQKCILYLLHKAP